MIKGPDTTKNIETENEFHPTCIISALCKTMLPPLNQVGVSDLMTYMFYGEKIESDPKTGKIRGYDATVDSLIERGDSDLKKQFPEIAAYAENLSQDDIGRITSSKDSTRAWIKFIEDTFGSSVQVRKHSEFISEELAEIFKKNEQRTEVEFFPTDSLWQLRVGDYIEPNWETNIVVLKRIYNKPNTQEPPVSQAFDVNTLAEKIADMTISKKEYPPTTYKGEQTPEDAKNDGLLSRCRDCLVYFRALSKATKDEENKEQMDNQKGPERIRMKKNQ